MLNFLGRELVKLFLCCVINIVSSPALSEFGGLGGTMVRSAVTALESIKRPNSEDVEPGVRDAGPGGGGQVLSW